MSTTPGLVNREKKNDFSPIVCLGGSAGAISAFKSFFSHLPADSGMAFVLIMHLDPNHQGDLSALIQTFTSIPVEEARDGILIEPNHIYVIPPNKDMGIHERKLMLLTQVKPKGFRLPIDYFLQSLAGDQGENAVAIIFSGMGSDGETGVRMIKEKLGLTMVQDPATAEFDSMPQASIQTNMVDYTLSPEEMPVKLIQYINHPVIAEGSSVDENSAIRNITAIDKTLMLLRTHTGHDFSMYKKSTIIRRIDRRLAFHQLPDYSYYIDYLRENPHELDILFKELLIGVTKFFRDPDAFLLLKNKLNILLKQKKSDEPVRIWVAGCSTGEEAYTIAIILFEAIEKIQRIEPIKVQIFATDLDKDAIDKARIGRYRSNILADISPERLDRFFLKSDEYYLVKKELREMIVFAQHNMIKDAPFTKLDILSCRNVMIYLTADLQKKLIPIFHYSLKESGLLLLGPAEGIGIYNELFRSVDHKWKLYLKKEGSTNPGKVLDFPFHINKQSMTLPVNEAVNTATKATPVADAFNRIILNEYSPAAVLIDERGDILYMKGKTSNFMDLPQGEAILNIHKMIREDLKYIVGNIIYQSRVQKTTITVDEIQLKEKDQTRIVCAKAIFTDELPLQGLVLLILEERGKTKKSRKQTPGTNSSDKQAEQLEKELAYTKMQLQSTIEQMETSLEELKSTNEELQSTNEELQSTNEESLTTKEEMQSLNEELMTINAQYQSKAEELTLLNNDMKNLLDSTEIGTIFLDSKLDILRFTPQVRKLFNLIPSDIGRSITHIVSTFQTPLEDEIRDVIQKLIARELEVKTLNNEWYHVRIMPYRTNENFINGAVLTFTKITPYKLMEFKYQAMQKLSAGLLNAVNDPAIQIDSDLKIENVNNAFLDQFRIRQSKVKGRALSDFVKEHWNTPELNSIIELCKSKTAGSIEFNISDHHDRPFKIHLNVKHFIDNETSKVLLVLVIKN